MATDQERMRLVYSLDLEMERAVALLKRGIEGQKALYVGETARFLFMVDLAGGTERMLKVAWAMGKRQQDGAYPPASKFKSIGHGLLRLADAVADLYSPEFLKLADARWAQQFLREDALFREALRILNHFATQGRYFHVDSLGGAAPVGDSPERHWAKLEMQVGKALFPNPAERSALMTSITDPHYRQSVGAEIALTFELMGCAMFRLLVLGLPDTDGRQWSVMWQRFLRVWRSGDFAGTRRVSSLS